MGSNTLPVATSNTVIPAAHHNALVTALNLTNVPRNASAVATDLGGGLGTSVLRWANSFIESVTIGTAVDGLRIYEGATDELWIENNDNDSIRLKQTATEFYRNGTLEFSIDSSGIVWSTQPNQSVPRSKMDLDTPLVGSLFASNVNNSGSFDTIDILNYTFRNGKTYLLCTSGQAIVSSNINFQANLRVRKAGIDFAFATYGQNVGATSPALAHNINTAFPYTHTAATGSVQIVWSHNWSSVTNVICYIREI